MKLCIPSISRSDMLLNKTLATLKNNNIDSKLIYIFVVESEFELYKSVVGNDYNIVIGVHGLVNQRAYIESYFEAGEHLIFFDDDVTEIDLTMTEYTSLIEFFNFTFDYCVDNNAFIWSVYPVFNPFFRTSQKQITTHLNFCIGTFYGIISRPNHLKLQINTYTNLDEKEDSIRTLLYFILDGIVVRFNKVGFKTKFYNKIGGMGPVNERVNNSIEACQILLQHFPEYGKIAIRKSGINEFKMKKIKQYNPDRSVTLLSKIDDELISNLYSELQNITIKQLGVSNVRLNFKPTNRSVVFGVSKGRFSGVVALSASSKKYPHIWKLINQIGDQLPSEFEYTSVFLNHNVVCSPHKDSNNVGKSILLSFGNYTGCNIVVDGTEYNTNRQAVLFNGSLLEHYNIDNLVGNKYSLVFFQGNY
jgi:hypothetical protein